MGADEYNVGWLHPMGKSRHMAGRFHCPAGIAHQREIGHPQSRMRGWMKCRAYTARR